MAGLTHGFATSDSNTFNDVDFPGVTTTQAIDVNDAGDIAGSYFDAANVEHGFVSSGGTFTAIDFPGATSTAAAGINANSDIVGGYTDTTGSHGFLLSGGAFTPINFPLASSTTAFGINDNGDIAGFYTDTAGKTHGFVYADNNFQHSGRRRRQRYPTDAHQELGTGDGRVHRRRERGTRPHQSVSDFDHQPRTGSKCHNNARNEATEQGPISTADQCCTEEDQCRIDESSISSAGQCRIEEDDTTETSRQTRTTSAEVGRPPGGACRARCGCAVAGAAAAATARTRASHQSRAHCRDRITYRRVRRRSRRPLRNITQRSGGLGRRHLLGKRYGRRSVEPIDGPACPARHP